MFNLNVITNENNKNHNKKKNLKKKSLFLV